MLSQSSRCEALKCQADLEKNYASKWQQVLFTFHTHFKREDQKREHIFPVNVIMDNQAGGENIMLEVKTFEKFFKKCVFHDTQWFSILSREEGAWTCIELLQICFLFFSRKKVSFAGKDQLVFYKQRKWR